MEYNKEEQIENIKDECVELKNIKYKTMLLNGIQIKETKSQNDLSNLEKFLEDEQNNNKCESWIKLDKTIKTQKIMEFIETYKTENELNEEEQKLLTIFLKDCLDKKKLSKVKDVMYDKDSGILKEIPGLCYIKQQKHFTLKNLDKRISTLKSLPPKKINGTVKNK